MWKVSWFYEKVHDLLVVPLYYIGKQARRKTQKGKKRICLQERYLKEPTEPHGMFVNW